MFFLYPGTMAVVLFAVVILVLLFKDLIKFLIRRFITKKNK